MLFMILEVKDLGRAQRRCLTGTGAIPGGWVLWDVWTGPCVWGLRSGYWLGSLVPFHVLSAGAGISKSFLRWHMCGGQAGVGGTARGWPFSLFPRPFRVAAWASSEHGELMAMALFTEAGFPQSGHPGRLRKKLPAVSQSVTVSQSLFFLFNFYFILGYSWLTILCLFQEYSKVIQLYICMYPFFFGFFSHIDY